MGMHRLIKNINPEKIVVEPLNLPPEEIEVEIPEKVVQVEELQSLDQMVENAEQTPTYRTVNIDPASVVTHDKFGPSWEPISDLEELKKALEELYVRFNTEPHRYIKFDYKKLLDALSKSLIHLYETDANLAPVAYSGDISDLTQQEYFILDCGTSTKNV